MSLPTEGKLLRIFVGEADRWHGRPLYEAIVLEARKRGLAGATVVKGFMGFGAHSRLHVARLADIVPDLPVVVEWIDSPEQVERLLPRISALVHSGTITVDDLTIVKHTHRASERSG